MNCVYYSKKSHMLFCHYHFFYTISHVRIYVCTYFSISVFHERFFFSCSWIRPYQVVWLGSGYILQVKSVSKLSPTEIGVGTYLMSVACFPLRVCQNVFTYRPQPNKEIKEIFVAILIQLVNMKNNTTNVLIRVERS